MRSIHARGQSAETAALYRDCNPYRSSHYAWEWSTRAKLPDFCEFQWSWQIKEKLAKA